MKFPVRPMSLTQRLRRRLFPLRGVIEGYESEELVDVIFRKTIAYQGEANWPLVAGLRTVLDFGGGAGVHYKTARQQSPDIRWAVVETPAMVQRATNLATDRLKFFEDIDEAAEWLGDIDLVHSDGAIQYVPDAPEIIRRLCSVEPVKLAWYRVPISAETKREVQTSYLGDNGPGTLPGGPEKLVRYERTWLSERTFIEAHDGYFVANRGSDSSERGTQHFTFVRL